MLRKIVDKTGYYIAVDLSLDKNDSLEIKEVRSILFNHSKCSEVRGNVGKCKFNLLNLENIKIGEDMKHFIAWSVKNGVRFYIIYKFLNKQDPCGYDIYDAVTIVNHS